MSKTLEDANRRIQHLEESLLIYGHHIDDCYRRDRCHCGWGPLKQECKARLKLESTKDSP